MLTRDHDRMSQYYNGEAFQLVKTLELAMLYYWY